MNFKEIWMPQDVITCVNINTICTVKGITTDATSTETNKVNLLLQFNQKPGGQSDIV